MRDGLQGVVDIKKLNQLAKVGPVASPNRSIFFDTGRRGLRHGRNLLDTGLHPMSPNPIQPRKQIKNVFEAILEYGHDEDFVPKTNEEFQATDAPAGSDAKIEILRNRVLEGMPLWHDEDRCDYSGLTGAVRPRE